VTRTVYYTATSLDGFIADDEDSLAWLFVQDQDEGGPLNYEQFRAGLGAGCMGSTTYEWILEHEKGSWSYTLPMWVFTHRDLPPNDGVTFVRDDVPAVHQQMVEAAGGKDIWVVGGGDLAGQFADAGLLDEVITYVAPVTLGSGRPLLPRRLELRLEETQPNKAFITARFSVVGPGTWGT
jgi:dihydrofolate reductase